MTGITLYPATTGQNQICWNGIPDSSETVLFINSDLNNIAYLGFTPNINPGGSDVIPIAPNASIILPANRTVYAIWSASVGVAPLVVIPGGAGYFLGITQGLGNLAIPSVQSPNFVHNVSGWQISKNGNAEFNNLTLRGTFFGTNYVINSTGLFFYSGVPALGNLIASITQLSGTDSSGNAYLPGVTSYINAAGIFYASSSQSGQFNILTAAAAGGPWTTIGSLTNDGLGNLLIAATGARLLVTTSEFQHQNTLDITQLAAPGTLAGYARLWADNVSGALKFNSAIDGNTYAEGWSRTVVPSTILINSTTPIVIVSKAVAAISYRVHIQIYYVGGAVAANAGIGWDGNATISNTIGTVRRVRNSNNTEVPLAVNQNSAVGLLSLAFAIGELESYEFDGIVSFSGAGTFNIRGQEGTAGDTWSVAANSYMEISPL